MPAEVIEGEVVEQRAIAVVRPLQSAEEALADWQGYQRLTHAILDQSDYQKVQGKDFKKKSAWRKYAKAFNLSDEVVAETIVRRHDEKTCEILHNPEKLQAQECSCPTTYARYRVRCLAPNGRVTEGVGVCSTKEQRGFSKPEHDIPATAHTRAKNRAISDMIGAGEVSAEEATADAPDDPNALTNVEERAYQAAWKAASDEQRDAVRAFLAGHQYKAGEFVSRGKAHYGEVMRKLGADIVP